MKHIFVNAMGDACPIPVIKTKKALEQLGGEGGQLEVHVDNEIAVQNISKMAVQKGLEYNSEKLGDREYRVFLRADVREEDGMMEFVSVEEETCHMDAREDTVVAITSDVMGSGNDELGKVLMKGFIYALTQLDSLPSTILFYNGGATLTTEGSDSIEDLKSLEAQGVEILTCGTCLNYYGLSDKLMVGSVTNMYTIVEKLAGTKKIIRP